MSNEPEVRRILVALDDSADGRAALEAAARLAVVLRAELRGLFVEDVNVLRLAELPFACEVCSSSAAQRPLTPDAVERSFRAVAGQVRSWIEDSARRAQLPWSFHIKRGPVARASLEASDEADVMLIGVHSISPRHTEVLPGRAGKRELPPAPVLVVYDGTASARRAVQAALDLTSDRAAPLEVYVISLEPSETTVLQDEVDQLVGGRPDRVVVHAVPLRDARQLIEVVQSRRAQLLLLNRDSTLLDGATLSNLVTELDCPVGIVR